MIIIATERGELQNQPALLDIEEGNIAVIELSFSHPVAYYCPSRKLTDKRVIGVNALEWMQYYNQLIGYQRYRHDNTGMYPDSNGEWRKV